MSDWYLPSLAVERDPMASAGPSGAVSSKDLSESAVGDIARKAKSNSAIAFTSCGSVSKATHRDHTVPSSVRVDHTALKLNEDHISPSFPTSGHQQVPTMTASPHTLVPPHHLDTVTNPSSVLSRLTRQDSDTFLSYYGSEDAGRRYNPPSPDQDPLKSPEKQLPTDPSSSRPSFHPTTEEDQDKSTVQKPDLPVGSRRLGTRTEGGPDRRRLAIVQMDSSFGDSGEESNSDVTPSSNLRSRRGFGDRLGDLALVAPPDASPRMYTHLTPPSTAPPSGDRVMQHESTTYPHFGSHHRSRSDAVNPAMLGGHYHRSPPISSSATDDHQNQLKQPLPYLTNEAVTSPIFHPSPLRSPSSRVLSKDAAYLPSLSVSPPGGATPTSPRGKHPILTPDIGQEKDVNVSVAPPVVVNLASVKVQPMLTRKLSSRGPASDSNKRSMPTPPSTPSSAPLNLNHQSAPLSHPKRTVHNVGPNPSPPPRPPRLHSPHLSRNRSDVESATQTLQLPITPSATNPQSSTSSLNSLSTQDTSDRSKISTRTDSGESTRGSQRQPVHRREGAFRPSVLLPAELSSVSSESKPTYLEDASKPRGATVDKNLSNTTDNLASMITNPLPVAKNVQNIPLRQGRELPPSNSQVNIDTLSREATPSSDPGGRASSDISSQSSSPSSLSNPHETNTPSPPPKSPKGLKVRLAKRFSALPRSPSVGSRQSSNGPRTPSPPTFLLTSFPPQKIRSQWPSAMQCSDILTRKTTLDRCAGYAQKINELYICDCGLSDWLTEVRYKVGLDSQRPTTLNIKGPSGFSSQTAGGQPRQSSRSSATSDVSFPRRLDASAATDLSIKSMDDIMVSTEPPPLPYPSLAQNPRRPTRSSTFSAHSSARALASPNGAGKSGGFFSSLSRMASVKKDKSGLSTPVPQSSSTGKLLVKNPPTNTIPRPVNIITAPSVPGGPRAPPHRAQRSQTVMISSRFTSTPSPYDHSFTRRPSLNELSSESVMNITIDPDFDRQVDKLADLLPRADRDVLAGYLRRAGQDILAIGQYLEDEKSGTIQHN